MSDLSHQRKYDELDFRNPHGKTTASSKLVKLNDGTREPIGYGSIRKILPLYVNLGIGFANDNPILFHIHSKNHININGRASHNVRTETRIDLLPQSSYQDGERLIVATVSGTLKEFSFVLSGTFIQNKLGSRGVLKLIASEENSRIVVCLNHNVKI